MALQPNKPVESVSSPIGNKFPQQQHQHSTINGGGGHSGWVRVSHQNPCPICGKPDNCTVSSDVAAVWCGRVSDGSKAENAGGQYLHFLTDDRPDFVPIVEAPVELRDHTPAALKYAMAALSRLGGLAAELGVSVASLKRLFVGRILDGVWSFPERDASAKLKVIGINRRFADGSKRQVSGHKRGLTYAADWTDNAGPVVLVEGGSDTAAGLTLGLCTIGRPSNLAGVSFLLDLLAGCDRDIIVIGERDEKPDGTWPGREGAIKTAERLAAGLGRPISWALPPDGAKDLREWLQGHADCDGDEFVSQLDLLTIEVEAVEVPEVDDREVISLDDWRDQLRTARTESLKRPGVYLDKSPTGAGKSFADQTAIRQASSSLVILPTHDNCRELARDLQADGIDAQAYPERTEDNCSATFISGVTSFQAAQRAESIGVSVQSSICQGCPLGPKNSNQCMSSGGYLHAINEASQAIVTVATHARATVQGFASLADGRRFVAVHENATALLRPTASVRDSELAVVESILGEWLDRWTSNEDLHRWVSWLCVAATYLRQVIRKTDETGKVEPPPALTLADPPTGLWSALLGRFKGELTGGSDVFRVLVDLAGWKSDLAVQVIQWRGDGGTIESSKRLIATRANNIPNDGQTIWFEDATADRELIEDLTGRNVIDRTPAGRLERLHSATQIPRAIWKGTAERTVRNELRGILADRPDAKRVGVICWQNHVEAVESVNSELAFSGRIHKVEYFHGGTDRSSNGWHTECDLLVILGSPTVNGNAIAQHLIQTNNTEAAALDGEWSDRPWQGQTVDGAAVQVEGRGYSQPDWRAAHARMVRAALIQAIGRARSFQTDGIPVVVVATDECGLPVSDRPSQPMNETESMVLAAVVGLSATNPISSLIEKVADKTGLLTRDVAAVVGKPARTVRRYLNSLEKRGLVQKVGDRKAARWLLVRPEMDDLAAEFVATWQERAAIIEYDATIDRETATIQAWHATVEASTAQHPPVAKPPKPLCR